MGDTGEQVRVARCAFPITYCMVHEENGLELSKKVGHEPAGSGGADSFETDSHGRLVLMVSSFRRSHK